MTTDALAEPNWSGPRAEDQAEHIFPEAARLMRTLRTG
jgi:hypothetical protein